MHVNAQECVWEKTPPLSGKNPNNPDPWAPMVAPGPQSGRADQSNVIFVIYALLHASLTDFARSVIILIFEVCMVDCPKSWSGLLQAQLTLRQAPDRQEKDEKRRSRMVVIVWWMERPGEQEHGSIPEPDPWGMEWGFFPKVVGFFPIRILKHSCASVYIYVHCIVFLKH
jgi:hypothetical protein